MNSEVLEICDCEFREELIPPVRVDRTRGVTGGCTTARGVQYSEAGSALTSLVSLKVSPPPPVVHVIAHIDSLLRRTERECSSRAPLHANLQTCLQQLQERG